MNPPAKARGPFTVRLLEPSLFPYFLEWLDYGQERGLGQWRNSDVGQFTAQVTEAAL